MKIEITEDDIREMYTELDEQQVAEVVATANNDSHLVQRVYAYLDDLVDSI